jgi:hypothetical protein
MQVTFKSDEEKSHFLEYLKKFEIDDELPAFDLIAIFQFYENALVSQVSHMEKVSKARTYLEVALLALNGK